MEIAEREMVWKMSDMADENVDTKETRKLSREHEVYNLPAGPKDLCFDKNEFIKVSPFGSYFIYICNIARACTITFNEHMIRQRK